MNNEFSNRRLLLHGGSTVDALGRSGGAPHAGVLWTGSSPTGRSAKNTGLVGGPTPPVLSPTILEVSLPFSACGLRHHVLQEW